MIHVLNLAIQHKAELIIIDETLDLVSKKNLEKILKDLENSNKMILVITHKKEIIEKAQQKIVLD